MKILVTGGNGFIGSHLTDSLAEEGFEIASLDANLNFANNDEYYKKCLLTRKKYLKNKPSKVYIADIRSKNAIKKAMRDFKPEVVVHLAGLPMARVSKNHTKSMSPINLTGTLNVISLAESEPYVKKIVYASSSMAYGHFKQIPQTESITLEPENEYGAAKAAGEYYLRLCKKEWTIVRPTSVYGFTDCANRVSQILIDAAHYGKNAWVLRGENLDFSYIKDVVNGFILVIKKPIANHQVFNISSGEARSTTEFAQIVKSHFPKFDFEIKEPDSLNIYRGPMDISKARQVLKFDPKYSVEEGVKEIIKLAREYNFYSK